MTALEERKFVEEKLCRFSRKLGPGASDELAQPGNGHRPPDCHAQPRRFASYCLLGDTLLASASLECEGYFLNQESLSVAAPWIIISLLALLAALPGQHLPRPIHHNHYHCFADHCSHMYQTLGQDCGFLRLQASLCQTLWRTWRPLPGETAIVPSSS